MKSLLVFVFVFSFFLSDSFAQEKKVRWQRKKALITKTELFHSIQAVNLPTTTTLRKSEFEYEISHRFLPTLSTEKSFVGIDGPAQIRMALSYGISDRIILTLGRSNKEDNVDLRVKYNLRGLNIHSVPVQFAILAGSAWNTQINHSLAPDRETSDIKNFQYYSQLVINGLLMKKLGIGIVPSYLYNSHIYCDDTQYSFTTGFYIQYYVSSIWSVLLETNTTVTGFRGEYNSVHFGIELETGGHFFKIFFGNNAALNPGHYLAGSDLKFTGDNLRLGFVITRILKF